MIKKPTTKTCKTCEQEKSLEDFYRHKDTLDRRHSKCKICYKKEIKLYDLTHKKEIKEYCNSHKKERKAYVDSHKEEALKWERNNRDKCRACDARREALKLNSSGHFTAQEWTDLCDKYGNICLKCRKKKKLTVDHIIPLIKGGSNYISNVQPLCLSCNSSKGTKIIDYRIKVNKRIKNAKTKKY